MVTPKQIKDHAMRAIRALIAFSILTGIVVGAVWGFAHIAQAVGLKSSLIWTGLVGVIAWVTKQAVEQQKERRRLLATEKREQYLQFLDFLNETFGLSGEEKSGEMTPEKVRQFRRWSLHLTLIGSDPVVRAFNAARLSNAAGAELLRVWGAVAGDAQGLRPPRYQAERVRSVGLDRQ